MRIGEVKGSNGWPGRIPQTVNFEQKATKKTKENMKTALAKLEPVPKGFDSILAGVLRHKSGAIAGEKQSTSRKVSL